MNTYLLSLKSAVGDFAERHPRVFAMLVAFAIANLGSQCAHRVDPKVGKVYDAVAPVVVTEIVDAVAEDASSTSTGPITVDPVTVIGGGGAGGL